MFANNGRAMAATWQYRGRKLATKRSRGAVVGRAQDARAKPETLATTTEQYRTTPHQNRRSQRRAIATTLAKRVA
eukprot:11198355-Lingulodinium_polyedra.AAC.1